MKRFVVVFIFAFFLISQYPNIRVSSVFASDNLYFLHTDHLGSTRVVTDSAGNPVAEYDYYPYGTINHSTIQPFNHDKVERLYTNQIYDQTADLYFYNSRYYNPRIGTFISPDPVQGPNRFGYVSGNPLNLIDPSGNMVDVGDGGGFKQDDWFFPPWEDRGEKDVYWSSTELDLTQEEYLDLWLNYPSVSSPMPWFFRTSGARDVKKAVFPIIEEGIISGSPGPAFRKAAATLLAFGIEVRLTDPANFPSGGLNQYPSAANPETFIPGGEYRGGSGVIYINARDRQTPEIIMVDLYHLGHELFHATQGQGPLWPYVFLGKAFLRTLSSDRTFKQELVRMRETEAYLWEANIAYRAKDLAVAAWARQKAWSVAGYIAPNLPGPIIKSR